MTTRRPVPVYLRVHQQPEVCIGTAKTMSDVPGLLESVAKTLREGLEPDEFETGIVRTPESFS